MSPQQFQSLTIQQQEKVISVTQSRLENKTKEVDALFMFSVHAPAAVYMLVAGTPEADDVISEPSEPTPAAQLKTATEQYFEAKHSQALMELEELQLTVKALKQMQSPIVGASSFR